MFNRYNGNIQNGFVIFKQLCPVESVFWFCPSLKTWQVLSAPQLPHHQWHFSLWGMIWVQRPAGLQNEQPYSPLKILHAPSGPNVFHSHSARGCISIPRKTVDFFKNMFSEWKICGKIRSSGGVDLPWEWLGMSFPDELWEHEHISCFPSQFREVFTEMPVCSSSFILFVLLFLRHLKRTIGSKVPSQVWWGFLEGQLLLNVIIVHISFFLSKEFQNERATLHIPDVVVKQNFGTFERKFNPLKFSRVPALQLNTDKNVFVQRFTWLPQRAASPAAWLSPRWADTPYCKFHDHRTPGC